MLYVIMQYFKTFDGFWMESDFLKDGVSYLMQFYNTKNRDFPIEKIIDESDIYPEQTQNRTKMKEWLGIKVIKNIK